MNAFSQPQKSHSSFGTMKNGMKIGPTRTQTAVAIKPKAITTMAIPGCDYGRETRRAQCANWTCPEISKG